MVKANEAMSKNDDTEFQIWLGWKGRGPNWERRGEEAGELPQPETPPLPSTIEMEGVGEEEQEAFFFHPPLLPDLYYVRRQHATSVPLIDLSFQQFERRGGKVQTGKCNVFKLNLKM